MKKKEKKTMKRKLAIERERGVRDQSKNEK